jgi:formylglycine-generating enzyme required for sulfatase activity
MLLLLLTAALPAQSPEGVRAVGAPRWEAVQPTAWQGVGFDPAQSAGLFIGVNTFEDTQVRPLRFAVDDAIDLAWQFWQLGLVEAGKLRLGLAGTPTKAATSERLAALRAAGTPEPFLPSKNATNRQILWLRQNAGANGMLLFHCSTHGFYEGGVDAVLMTDSVLDRNLASGMLRESSLSHALIMQNLRLSPAPRRLVMMDACRENMGSDEETRRAIGGAAALPRQIAQELLAVTGTALLLAAPVGGYGFDGGRDPRTGAPIENGVFTHYLLASLTGEAPPGPDGFLRLDGAVATAERLLTQWQAVNSPESQGGISKTLEASVASLPLRFDPETAEATAKAEADRIAREKERAEAARRAEADRIARETAQRNALIERKKTAFAYLGAANADFDNKEIPPETVAKARELLGKPYDAQQEALLVALETLQQNTAPNRHYFQNVLWPKIAPTLSTTPVPTSPPSTPVSTSITSPSIGSISRPGTNSGDRAELTLPGGVKMAFRWCPPGSFTMGSPPSEAGQDTDENQVQVRLSRGFGMAETEVTQAQWRAVMGTDPSSFKGDNLPVEQVSWDDAVEFCRKLSSSSGLTVSLPTEAQWEYACRAGTTTPFHFGSTITPDQVNYDGEYPYGNAAEGVYREKTTQVGSFPANAWGLRDMHGNVWEWCADWYASSLPGGTDPTGPSSGSHRVVRGGSWYSHAQHCRAAFRLNGDPTAGRYTFGFRPVLSVQ